MSKAATLCLHGPQQSPATHLYAAFLSWWQLELSQSPFTGFQVLRKAAVIRPFLQIVVLLVM